MTHRTRTGAGGLRGLVLPLALFLLPSALPASAQQAALSYNASFAGVGLITDLTAVAGPGGGEITLQWTAPRYTGSNPPLTYQIKASTTGNIANYGQFQAAAPLSAFSGTPTPPPSVGGSAQSLTVTGLAAGQTFCFALQGADSGAPGVVGRWLRSVPLNWNVPNCAIPLANPAITQVFLSSISVNYPFSAGASGYEVDASTASDFSGLVTSSATFNVALTTLAPQGLFPNTTYYLRAGPIIGGTTVFALTVPTSTSTLSLPVTGTSAFAVFTTSVTVNWNPLLAVPPAVTSMSAEGYVLQASTAADFSGTIFSSATAGVQPSTLTVSGLSAATTYFFRVGSLNWDGVPDFAASIATQTFAPPPLNPLVFQVFPSSISVTYGLVPGPVGYEVDASTLPDFSGLVTSSVTYNVAQTTLAPQGLFPNTTYYLRAGAIYPSGTTGYALTTPVSTPTLASPVTGAQVAAVFFTSVTVNWTPLLPGPPSSVTAEGYLLQASTSADFSGVLFTSATAGVQPSTLTVTGLTTSTTYFFRVGTLNWDGVPDFVLAGSTRTINLQAPGNPVITQVFLSSISVNYGLVSGPVGYEVDASTASDFSGLVTSSVTFNVALATLAPQGLFPNTTYYLRAGAIYSGATVYALTTPSTSTLANPVTGAQVFAVYVASVTLNWIPLPTSPSSMSAEGYLLQASTAADFSGTIFSSATAGVSLSTLTVSGLTGATTYFFRVGSLNWDGVPDFVLAGSTRTLSPPPASPVIYRVYLSSISVAYGAIPGSNGYEVDASTASNFSGLMTSSVTFSVNVTTLAPQGLFPNTTYYLRAGALYGGTTVYAMTVPASTSTLANPVANTAVLSIVVSSITVSWTALPPSPPDASSKTAEGYLLQASTSPNFAGVIFSSATPSVLQSTLTVTGLTLGATYYLRVGSLNWDGVADFAASVSTFVPVPVCPADEGVDMDTTAITATVRWAPQIFDVNGNTLSGNNVVTYYALYKDVVPATGTPTMLAMLPANVTSYTDVVVSTGVYYYSVAPGNPACRANKYVSRAFPSRDVYVTGGDNASYLRIPASYAPSFTGNFATSVRFTSAWNRGAEVKTPIGLIFNDQEFLASIGFGQPYIWSADPNGVGMATLFLHYQKSGSGVGTSGFGASDIPSTPNNLSVYWNNGSKFVQLYGKLDTLNQGMVLQTKYSGEYQIRSVERTGGFAFDSAGVSNRFITPNGDGKNDSVVFTYDNPNNSTITGTIYDLKGAPVANMSQGPVANSLMWDGKSNGRVVPGGVYIYQLTGENQTFNGTVIVVK